MTNVNGAVTQQTFLQDLVEQGYFVPSGEPGLYGRSAAFENIRTAVDALVSRTNAPDNPELLRFPPLIPKQTLEKAGYLKSFPQLCGAVFSFFGDESSAAQIVERSSEGQDWSMHLGQTKVVLVPAACYPAYPAIALRGKLPLGGVTLDLGGCYVYRNEPSLDPCRLQMFHQRELVRIGEPEDVLAWRERWIARATEIFEKIAIDARLELASDPFFGRGGRLLAQNQREQGLKFEFVVPVASPEPTAICSLNFHQEHFGSVFEIRLNDGSTASSACVGFGLERITLALLKTHGMNTADWPDRVRTVLWPESPRPERLA